MPEQVRYRLVCVVINTKAVSHRKDNATMGARGSADGMFESRVAFMLIRDDEGVHFSPFFDP